MTWRIALQCVMCGIQLFAAVACVAMYWRERGGPVVLVLGIVFTWTFSIYWWRLLELCDEERQRRRADADDAARVVEEEKCTRCHGTGEVPVLNGGMMPRPQGMPLPKQPCPSCHGEGMREGEHDEEA